MSDEPKLVASPLAVAGAVVASIGIVRRSPLAILAGGLAIGYGLKLIPRR